MNFKFMVIKLEDIMTSQINDFYSDKCILLTGASGFIGKQVLEKLLRSCPRIKNIYILLRKNNKHSVTERFHNMLKTPLFNQVCESSMDVMKIVKVVEGDVLLPQLGIIDDSLFNEIINNVSVVFHLAATIGFNEPLKMAINMNIIGLKKILDFCDDMLMLKALVHVSTAFSNCTQKEIEEKVYPGPVPYSKLLKAIEWLPDEVINILSEKITKLHPNTYTFTKAIAEEMLFNHPAKYSIAIFRPSIVTATLYEPIPGWVDNLNGATGVFAAIGTGFVKAVYGNPNMVADFVPVDLVANAIISVGWTTAIHQSQAESPKCYNFTSGTMNPILWNKIGPYITSGFLKYPMENLFSIPLGWVTDNRLSFIFYSKFCIYIRLVILEIHRKYFTHNKRNMLRIYRNCHHLLKLMEYFTSREWIWTNNNVLHLMTLMSVHDRKIFNFDTKQINWQDYIEAYSLGIRRYVLHQNPNSLPFTRRIVSRIYLATIFIKILVVIITFHLLSRRSDLIKKCLSSMQLASRLNHIFPFVA